MDKADGSERAQFKTTCAVSTSALTVTGAQERGCRSVSCVVTLMSTHCLRVQVAAAEFVALVEGASFGIGMQPMARDVGTKSFNQAPDSAPSLEIASRVARGKMRHLAMGVDMDTALRESPKPSDPRGCRADIRTKDANAETLKDAH